MTVSARSAKKPAETANVSRVRLRRGGQARAGSYVYEGHRLVTGWHSHDMHQIEYAVSGVVEVETASAHYLLPPQQAAWIPAGLSHQATMNADVRTVSVMFDPPLVPGAGDRARILAVSPLIREMVIYALRWPIDRAEGDAVSDGFFRTLGHLVSDALDHEAPLSLPTSDDPIVAAALAYTKDHLDSVSAAEVSRAVAVSERTLRRQFNAVLGLSWRTYLLQARLLRAMALLAGRGHSVREVATAVGFDNVSSFARAFAQYSGETPSSYRRRVARCQAELMKTLRESDGKASTQLWGGLVVVLATVATWWVWLGRDTTYQVDPATGTSSGPYEAWQVIGCVACLAAIVVAAGLVLRPWLAPAVVTVTFTAIWSWWAGRSDESGLWLVGAFLIFLGLAWGSSVLSVGAWLGLGRKLHRPRA
jgi:AraC-like DNA-binding protein/quercetin dioxygenase-like cupin family protein